MELALLSDGHNALAAATTQNALIFQDVARNLDLRLGILMLAVEDLVAGTARVDDETRRIDWPRYRERYLESLQQREEAGCVEEHESSARSGNGGDDDLVIFGD